MKAALGISCPLEAMLVEAKGMSISWPVDGWRSVFASRSKAYLTDGFMLCYE